MECNLDLTIIIKTIDFIGINNTNIVCFQIKFYLLLLETLLKKNITTKLDIVQIIIFFQRAFFLS